MKKILIIEDDAVLGDILLQKLGSAGYKCDLVRDGGKGLSSIAEIMPDLIVLDIFLPLVNGIEILDQKRLDPKISHIPVIVLSNSLHPTSGTQMEKLGAVDFMVKSNMTTGGIVGRIQKILEPTVTAEKDHPGLIGKRILLVEDDNFLGGIILARLKAKQVETAYAKSGEDALIELKKQKPDVVLLDILLPGIDGFGVLQAIRDNPETKEVPVIVISNFNQTADIEKAKAMGARFLVKALVNPDTIIGEIEKVLAK